MPIILNPNAIVLGQIEDHCESTIPLGTTPMTNPLMTILPMQVFPLICRTPNFPIHFFLSVNMLLTVYNSY